MKQAKSAVYAFFRWLMHSLAVGLNKVSGGRIRPDDVTIFGLLMHLPIAYLIVADYWVAAAFALAFFGLFDTLDGELARMQRRVSNKGALLDAVTDRMKEVILYTAIAYAFAIGDHPATAAWAAAALGASVCVSYVRAKAETIFAAQGRKSVADLNKEFRDGLLPFEIRMFVLILGLLTGTLVWVVAAIAMLASYTALDRLARIRKVLRHDEG